MNSYALIIPVSRFYMPGANATLNALEVYGFEVDAYVLTWGEFLTDEYKTQWPSSVHFRAIDASSLAPDKHMGWYTRWADVKFGAELLCDECYDAVALWGGDSCIVNNFMDYFDIATQLNKLILATNEHGCHSLDRLGKEWPYKNGAGRPYADAPFIVPASRVSVLDRLLEWVVRPDHKLAKMTALNYAVRDEGGEAVFEVPGELWVQNLPQRTPLARRGLAIYIRGSSTRLNSFHRKYWNIGKTWSYFPRIRTDTMIKNKLLFNWFYNYLNKECRVKWTEGVEVWDGSFPS